MNEKVNKNQKFYKLIQINYRKLVSLFLLSFVMVSFVVASSVASSNSQRRRRVHKSPQRSYSKRPSRSQNYSDLSYALKLAREGKYQEASRRLFSLSFQSKYAKQRLQIRYILGMMFYQMRMNQLAAFQFITVVKAGKSRYLKQSLEKLSLAADALEDDTILHYAISKVNINDFPRELRDMLYFRIGETQFASRDLKSAIVSFSRVRSSSPFYNKAKYLEAVGYDEIGQPQRAISTFEDLDSHNADQKITSPNRVAAKMGIARSYYQLRDWDRSIEYYREVPRDTPDWHETLFESSWAMLRAGQFRSALSNFQTLHSNFYDNFYLPESLLLRAIVYLYICKYQEMEKVLQAFSKIYDPISHKISKYLNDTHDYVQYYEEVTYAMDQYALKGDSLDRSKFKIPFIISRKISKEGDYQRSHRYIKKLYEEKQTILAMPKAWRHSSLGGYAMKIINNRILKAKAKAGREIRSHLIGIKQELFELSEQQGFIRYEMINGKKEMLKKRVAGKDLPGEEIDEKFERDYYVQKGYQYWPYDGENWLDELGNYHYLGTQSCR